MSVFLWVCLGLGLVAGLLEAWSKNQNKINTNAKKNENTTVVKGFNSKKVGSILGIAVVILGILAIMGFYNLGSDNIISGNKKYEEVAQQYIEQISGDYLS